MNKSYAEEAARALDAVSDTAGKAQTLGTTMTKYATRAVVYALLNVADAIRDLEATVAMARRER